jgi:Flp pilus assembly protein TadG
MLQWKRLTEWLRADDGTASLEFITTGVLLLVPLVYLVLAISSIQGASLAVEGAARQAARVYVQAPSADSAKARVGRAVEFALADYGLESGSARVDVSCTPNPDVCLTRNGSVTVTVRVSAPLPLVPDVLDLRSRASVPMQSSATQVVSRFWSAG